MNPFQSCQAKDGGECTSTGVYIHVIELPPNSLIPSRYLMRVYQNEKWNRINKNQRVKYIENDDYPNWRECASVVEQFATVPSEGRGFLFEFNNMHNGNL